MADFDPNASPVILKPFMTHIAGRRPATKLHANLGQAKNAVGYQLGRGARGGKVWQWKPTDETWDLLYDVAPGTRHEELPWNQGERTYTWEQRKVSRRRITVRATSMEEAKRLFDAGAVATTEWTVESNLNPTGPYADRKPS